MICSLCSVGGATPDSTGRKAIGVDCRHLVIICMMSYKATSSFVVCVLLHHTGAAYSAALQVMAVHHTGSSILSRTASDGECTTREQHTQPHCK